MVRDKNGLNGTSKRIWVSGRPIRLQAQISTQTGTDLAGDGDRHYGQLVIDSPRLECDPPHP